MRLVSKTAAVTALMVLSAFTSPAPAQEKVQVVATFSILTDLTQQVGGERVTIKTLVGPESDAHVYQPTPTDSSEIAKARLVIANGLKFEGWMEKLVKSSGFKGQVVTATNGIKPIKGGDAHAHDHGKSDPHAWQNAANVLIYVKNIRDGLCKADAAGCETYTRNAAQYSTEIQALDAEIKAKLKSIPADRRRIITSHDAFGYFASAYGVKFIAPRGISTESEASAKDVAKLITQIRKDKVTALFVENITDTRLIEQIARETKVKIGGRLYSDALSKTEGPAATYLKMMRHNLSLLAEAMSSGS
ncbi:MAG: metal ABC transporter substrate-binding protein [Hyphomicrobiaceae bacterium]|nr:MAG: metal ABC transporter substrate-binding protein [Hyphomicrobiaceae bacterium]